MSSKLTGLLGYETQLEAMGCVMALAWLISLNNPSSSLLPALCYTCTGLSPTDHRLKPLKQSVKIDLVSFIRALYLVPATKTWLIIYGSEPLTTHVKEFSYYGKYASTLLSVTYTEGHSLYVRFQLRGIRILLSIFM